MYRSPMRRQEGKVRAAKLAFLTTYSPQAGMRDVYPNCDDEAISIVALQTSLPDHFSY